jgi:hypothetical protein
MTRPEIKKQWERLETLLSDHALVFFAARSETISSGSLGLYAYSQFESLRKSQLSQGCFSIYLFYDAGPPWRLLPSEVAAMSDDELESKFFTRFIKVMF